MGDFEDDNPFADAAVLDAQEYNDPPTSSSSSQQQPSASSSSSGKKKSSGLFWGGSKKGGEKADEAQLFQGESSSSGAPPPAYTDPNPFVTAGSYSSNPYDSAQYNTNTTTTNNSIGNSNDDEALRRKEAELRRKEEELNMKMKMQDQMQQQLHQQQQQQQVNAGGAKPPNWPRCKPIIYHSIPDEIPQENQRQVQLLYYSWYLTLFALSCNIIGTMCILIGGQGGKDFGFAIMYLPIIGFLSFYTWYRPVYNAYMKDKSFYFLLYLFFGAWNVAFELYIIIGLPDTGSSGFINMINLFGTKNIGGGVVSLLALLVWMFSCGVHAFQWRQVYVVYKSRGHTIADARNQAFSNAAKTAAQSEAGREAISSAVTGAATGMMQGNQQRV